MSILSGNAILSAHSAGEIEIDPFDPEQINPASYDLRLGPRVLVYSKFAFASYDDWSLENPDQVKARYSATNPNPIDVKVEELIDEAFVSDKGFVLTPGVLYLMHTVERVCTKTLVPIVDGKSSIGRLGVFVHVTAGYGDPGFDGQYTLEVLATYPTRIYAGMRFCQIRFHRLEGEPIDYQVKGSYPRESAPVASRAWKQFAKKA